MNILYTIPAADGLPGWVWVVYMLILAALATVVTLAVHGHYKRVEYKTDSGLPERLENRKINWYVGTWMAGVVGLGFIGSLVLIGVSESMFSISTASDLAAVGFKHVLISPPGTDADFLGSLDGQYFEGALVDLPDGTRGVVDVTP